MSQKEGEPWSEQCTWLASKGGYIHILALMVLSHAMTRWKRQDAGLDDGSDFLVGRQGLSSSSCG
jgi:hypothetical protein